MSPLYPQDQRNERVSEWKKALPHHGWLSNRSFPAASRTVLRASRLPFHTPAYSPVSPRKVKHEKTLRVHKNMVCPHHTFSKKFCTVCKSPDPSAAVLRMSKKHAKNSVKITVQGLPGGPVGKTPRSRCRGPGFDPWSGN